MPNLRAGFVITASLPTSTVLSASELLAERVAPIPLYGSTVVEGTVCPTAVSSPDDDIRGILAAGLWKSKAQLANRYQKYSILKATSYLPIGCSLGGTVTLPCRSSSTPRLHRLGISAWSRAEIPITPPFSFLLICIIKIMHKYCSYETSYGHIYTWLTDWEIRKNKRANKCLVVKDYF